MTDTHDALDVLLEEVFADAAPTPLAADWADVQARMQPRRLARVRVSARTALLRPRAGFAKRSWAFRASLAAGVGAAALLAVTLAPSGGMSPLDRAAAAVKVTGPVVHLVWTQEHVTDDRVLDVATGQDQAAPDETVDNWYDTGTGTYKQLFHGVDGNDSVQWRNDQHALNDAGDSAPADALPVPAVVALFEDYRKALQDGRARIVGDGLLDGRQVVFLDVNTSYTAFTAAGVRVGDAVSVERLALDRDTYVPVAVLPQNQIGADPSKPVVFHIQSVALVPRAGADLSQPAVTDHESPQLTPDGFVEARQSTVLSDSEIGSWLGRAPFGYRSSLAGLDFAAARGDLLNRPGSPEQRGLRLVYGASCDARGQHGGAYVVVNESTRPARFYGTQGLDTATLSLPKVLLTQFVSSGPECGAPATSFGQVTPEPIWYARVAADGLDVSIASPSKALAIRAARELLG
jgi:hypothetical protein